MRQIPPLMLLLSCSGAFAQPLATGPVARYDGYKLVAVDVRTRADVGTMEALGADLWSEHVLPGAPADYLVSPGQLDVLDASGLAYTVLIDDVQGSIDAENARLREGGRARGWFDDFKDPGAIDDRLDALAGAYPALASTFEVGRSLEDRPVMAIRIANDAFGDPGCKPTILFNACQHAREWIAPMVAMYAADQLLGQYGVDQEITDLVDRAEILVIPVVNADGYSFTWTNQRLWRKNRRDNGDGTFGVDLNRNWGYEWGHNNGSSGNPGSETYRGTGPFSEPATQIVRDLMLSRPRLAAQVDLHSYGRLILAPWGWSADEPPGHETFEMLGGQIEQIIEAVHGVGYTHGPCYTTLYPLSGGEGDWVWGDRWVHNFLIELRGTSFVLPPEQIIPNCEEVFPALVYFAEWARLERKPPGDFNDDARTDTQDVLAFLNAWAAGDPAADADGNGEIDTRDVLFFLNAWAGGC